MFLTVDIGNSNIVMGLHDGLSWVDIIRLSTHQESYDNILTSLGTYVNEIEHSILSSVVPSATSKVRAILQAAHISPYEIGVHTYPHLKIGVKNPTEIGTDLVSNAVFAHEKYPHDHKLIIDFGTALTFTTMDKNGQIVGVAIAPGLKTAMYSLFDKAEQLPEVPLEVPQSALGYDTTSALQAGVLLGYSHLVVGMINQIKTEMGGTCKVLATGGLSFIMEHIENVFDAVNVHLTLEGMRMIYFQAAQK